VIVHVTLNVRMHVKSDDLVDIDLGS